MERYRMYQPRPPWHCTATSVPGVYRNRQGKLRLRLSTIIQIIVLTVAAARGISAGGGFQWAERSSATVAASPSLGSFYRSR
jgi:hypothetical protein